MSPKSHPCPFSNISVIGAKRSVLWPSKCVRMRIRVLPRTPLGGLTKLPRPPSRLERGLGHPSHTHPYLEFEPHGLRGHCPLTEYVPLEPRLLILTLSFSHFSDSGKISIPNTKAHNPHFYFFDTGALWRSLLSVRVPQSQKWWVRPVWR